MEQQKAKKKAKSSSLMYGHKQNAGKNNGEIGEVIISNK
jgi:hypothetical protein